MNEMQNKNTLTGSPPVICFNAYAQRKKKKKRNTKRSVISLLPDDRLSIQHRVFCVSTLAVQEPASDHMELCLLLAAIVLGINIAGIKPIKVNKVHWMEFPLALAKDHLVIFWRMSSTWIHR